jgi:hypothetical protein
LPHPATARVAATIIAISVGRLNVVIVSYLIWCSTRWRPARRLLP